jgi:hypothetical protein
MAAEEFEPPEDESGDDGDETEEEEGEARPAVFVTTREPVMIVVSNLEDPRAPENSALAAYIDGRMIARSAMPPEAIARLLELRLFEEPVPLGLFAYEDAPGLQCRLFALVPRTALEGDSHDAEPWKESVPSFESSLTDDDDDEEEEGDEGDDEEDEDDDESAPFETILLGHIVRFEKDRRHPEDLAAEAVDILQRIIHGAESLEDADRKAIDDLLGSL